MPVGSPVVTSNVPKWNVHSTVFPVIMPSAASDASPWVHMSAVAKIAPSTRYSATLEPSGSGACLISPSTTSLAAQRTTVSAISDLEHGAAAVDADDLSGHERCLGGSKIGNH